MSIKKLNVFVDKVESLAIYESNGSKNKTFTLSIDLVSGGGALIKYTDIKELESAESNLLGAKLSGDEYVMFINNSDGPIKSIVEYGPMEER